MKQYALALDLKEDPELIAEYERYHQAVWPEVLAAIRAVGIVDMKIYRVANRLFMLMITTDDYDPEKAQTYLANDPKSVEWEKLMDRFQLSLPNAECKEQKWQPMTCCFDLAACL